MIRLKNKKAQSTLEYIILVTAVIVVIISLLVAPTSPFKKQLNTTLNGTIGYMEEMTDRFGNSMSGIGN